VAELAARIRALTTAGVDPGLMIVDPGLGFAKQAAHNWALLARLPELGALPAPGAPFPLLIGASRKRFIGRLLGEAADAPRPFTECDEATVALTALAAVSGAWCVRVHSVPGNADAVAIAARWRQELVS
jgi:dihydropteroate synthase